MNNTALNKKMLDAIPSEYFTEYLPATSENINWMYVVDAIDSGVSDLTALLAELDAHYAGPISIHEGYGGCEADSNQELITSKLWFDINENFEYHNVSATLAAIELGWVDFKDYEASLDAFSSRLTINPDDSNLGALTLSYCDDTLCIYAFGKTPDTEYLYQEKSELTLSESECNKLYLRIYAIEDFDDKNLYVRNFLKHSGHPLEPYNVK